MDCKKCKVKWKIYVELCPLHAAAGEMRKDLNILANKLRITLSGDDMRYISIRELLVTIQKQVRATIAKAESK